MGLIICIANQKGGVGKTTTVINLGVALSLAEKKTLLVDFDSQGHMTTGTGFDKKNVKMSIHDVFLGNSDVSSLIENVGIDYLNIIPAKWNMDETLISLNIKKLLFFNEAFNKVKEDFDYILIDCPPSLDSLTMNAMNMSDSVIIPIQCEYFAVESLGRLLRFIMQVKKDYNPNLLIEGILSNMFDKKDPISQRIAGKLRNKLNNIMFKTMVPESFHLRESACYRKPVLLHNINCDAAKSYLSLAGEIIGRTRSYKGVPI